MEAEIRPEPTDDERRAILVALEQAGSERRGPELTPWRRAALEAGDDYDATAPPRSSRGATRA
jgi:hypothetical protein